MKTSKLIITAIILLALISLAVPHSSALDVSCRAIKARESNRYSPNTAWDLGYTGKGINIAMLDSGVDDGHPSLDGKFVAGAEFTKGSSTKPTDGSYNPDDNSGHGTACAGVAMGTGGSEGTYMGVAPDAKLIDVKCFQQPTDKDLSQNFVKGIEWCIQHKDEFSIDIISVSAMDVDHTDGSDAWSRAMDKAVDAGIVVVQAVGNDGPDNEGLTTPCSDKAIVVGAIDTKNTINRNNDEIADLSSRGPRDDDNDDDSYDELKPDVVAPGASITTCDYVLIGQDATGYHTYSPGGTSLAAPHVAGVVALMLEANPALKPTPERNPIQEILRKTAESRGKPDSDLRYEGGDSYYNRSYGWGIVDAYEAVKAALTWSPPPEPNILPSISITSPGNNAKVSDIVTISGTASDSDGSVTNVELKFDDNDWFNVPIVSASSLEWNYTWNTKDVENGMHTIYAKAFDGMNYSAVVSVDVNVYNKVVAGAEQETRINPIYLISGASIIGAVVIVVVCLLMLRRKRLTGLPASVPPPLSVSQPVPSVMAKCPNCGNTIEITSIKRPFKVRCSKCGARSILR